MENSFKLPVGVDNFEKIRKEGFCYVDKTRLIEQLFGTVGRSKSVYQATPFRKDFKYEYAPLLF